MDSNPIALIAEIDHELRHRANAALSLMRGILARIDQAQIDPASQAYYDLLLHYLEQNVALAESIHAWLLAHMKQQ
ncbi:hypothetical protein [Herpetosiphon llansteffanensis]|uniref:hypothetical protein n=1 Tax=Herpetosiphon llansteffanensis TaxID=2094568 RepID=UPI000D7C4818|nr:hypothetical protein [Herpetosiphon llansteffanensis]